jgi:YfiR/HmsC-like
MIRRVLTVLAIIIIPGLILAQAQGPTEYQLKAAFIYNFPKFIEWPSSAGADPKTPIVIGILGKDPFGSEIEAVLSGKTANQRHFVIRRFFNFREVSGCQILFVSSSEKDNLKQVFAAVSGFGVLTVGESDRFAEAGGVIQWGLVDGKVRLTINLPMAERAGLRMSANLLRLAQVIRK